MTDTPQTRALKTYRRRLAARGLARFEVLGLDRDRDLIRSLARRLAENEAGTAQLRAEISRAITGEMPAKGGILAALRRSPLVGAEIEVHRPDGVGRKTDL